MEWWEVGLISLGVSVVVVLGADMTRAKGARVFNRGKDGEDTLVFDPTSKPKK